MRRGRRITRKNPGNPSNPSGGENPGSANPRAEFPNLGSNLPPNMAIEAPNDYLVQVSNNLGGGNQNPINNIETNTHQVPPQIPQNPVGIINTFRSSGAVEIGQQIQGAQEEVPQNISRLSYMSGNTSPFTYGAIPLLTNIGTITPFRGTSAENINEWITQFNWISNINQWTDSVKCALLPGYLEDVAKIWYSTLSVGDRSSYHIVQERLQQAFQQVTSPVQHLNQLLLRTQTEQESVETYAYSKLKLCEDLNKDMAESDRVTYLIQGMKPQLRSYLLDKKPSTVTQAIQLAREKQNNINLNVELRD
jgi:hypothetical protein